MFAEAIVSPDGSEIHDPYIHDVLHENLLWLLLRLNLLITQTVVGLLADLFDRHVLPLVKGKA